ncbi:hypothetical protein EGM88_04590 [Aureibaculum marinum]|uniref:Lipoprotein n=1 Tax=Aureibaculum marinum TaxID=2487930 RepID=A0A3N4P0D0_9FLAO|nr:hypothetical protein [Aureibaculum marinum]RPD98486.1 hypothetical protein EGM88_04590 [Aureibaculum marinum]
MKRITLFNYVIGILMITLFMGCPSECENDDGDCYTPYGPCDEQPENSSTEKQNDTKSQQNFALKIMKPEQIIARMNKNI